MVSATNRGRESTLLAIRSLAQTLRFVVFLAPIVGLGQTTQVGSGCPNTISGFTEQIPALIEGPLKRINAKIYSAGNGPTGRILELPKDEYRKRVESESIDPDTILIVDAIDLEVDPPLVAGIIVKTPLSIEGTHIQGLAQKMEIPLLYSKDIDLSDPFFKVPGYFAVQTEPYSHIVRTQKPIRRVAKPSIFPREYDRFRSSLNLISQFDPGLAREIVGGKYFDLARFQSSTNNQKLVPLIYSLPAVFYELFKKTPNAQGLTLQDFILARLQVMDSVPLEDHEIRIQLAEIRDAMATWPMPAVVSRVVNSVPFDGHRLSVRSNNDVEDLLAAGLYSSAFAYDTAEIESALRKVYASMYTYRAFMIRKAWGQREENLSMPILLHQYIEINEDGFNGVARVQRGRSGKITMELNSVKGSSHATNPGGNARSYKVTFNSDSKRVDTDKATPSNLVRAAAALFIELLPTLKFDLESRSILPQSIDLEVVFQRSEEGLRPWVLQYKHVYNRAIVLAVLEGRLERTELDAVRPVSSLPTETLDWDSVAYRMGAQRLKDFNPSDSGYRYVIVKNGENFEILVWNDWGRLHSEFQDALRINFPELKWVRSGYIDHSLSPFLSANRSNFISPKVLHFTVPTMANVDMVYGIKESALKNGFGFALKDAIQANGTFARGMKNVNSVEFQSSARPGGTFRYKVRNVSDD